MANWIFSNNEIEINKELLGVPVSVLRILKNRGVNEDQFEDFLADLPRNTYDPFLLDDLQAACVKILTACDEGENICVYGDYDADGVTSTTLMVSLLKHFTDKVSFYIPSRFLEGYGPNRDAIKRIKDNGCELLITVDCGITSKDEIDYAMSLGMDCIVTDHHILREGMTPNCLTVNPHRQDSKYPYSDLSGCGVAFKLAQGIQRILDKKGEGKRFSKNDLSSLLDLVAISTVADIVPLLDENRVLVKYGLNILNARERDGLRVLLSKLSLDGNVDASSISFTIAPNINALGRMDNASKGVELLESEKDFDELFVLADEIIETNAKRKSAQEQTLKTCREALSAGACGEYAPIIFAPEAHEGVAGIVAGILKEELNRPVCIVSSAEDGSLKGTGRSIPGINLHELFENCGDVFDRFGGHAGACGFTVKNGKLKEFRSRMQELVKAILDKDPDLTIKNIYVEKELDESEKTLEFAEMIKKLEPFGEANPVPIFCMRNVMATDIRLLGSEKQHIKFTAIGNDGIKVPCIFFWGASFESIVRNGAIDIAGEFGINEFRGVKQIQMKLCDIKGSEHNNAN